MIRLSRLRSCAGGVACAAGLVLACGTSLASEHAARNSAKVGFFELTGSPMEQPGALSWLFGGAPTMHDVLETIDSAGGDRDMKALVVQLKDAELTTTQVEEIGSRLKKLRESGKKTVLYSEVYGPSELMLGSFVDHVIIQRGGPVSLPGLYMEEMFLADTMKWVGLKADMVQVGDYKGASEQMMNNAPSKAWDQNISQLLDSMYANMRGTLMRGRGMSESQLDKAMDVAWMAEAQPAIDVKLIDAQLDLGELDGHLAKALNMGGDAEIDWTDDLLETRTSRSIDTSNPLAMMSQIMAQQPQTEASEPTIAVLHVSGTIIDGESAEGGLLGDSGVGSRTIRRAIDDIIDDDLIKGVIVRIDSPGGSATASEVMWQGLKKLSESKPVWASVGSMAASGGYYVASGTQKVYVNPSSIVGSIGVVGGKISMGGLYEWGKVNVVGRGRGPHADMFASSTTWTDAQRELIRGKMKETYDLFTSRVSAGRPGIDLSKTAEGRLFTGDKAIGLKMADQLGGLEDAISDLATTLELEEGFGVMHFPGPKSLGEALEDMVGGFVTSPEVLKAAAENFGANAAKEGFLQLPAELLGPQAWRQVRQGMGAMMLLRKEPVLVVTPRVMIFK